MSVSVVPIQLGRHKCVDRLQGAHVSDETPVWIDNRAVEKLCCFFVFCRL